MSVEERLLLISEIDNKLIEELADDHKREQKQSITKLQIGMIVGICAALVLVIGILLWNNGSRTRNTLESSSTENSSTDATSFASNPVITISGIEYVPSGPATQREYNLPDNNDITEADLGKSIGEVEHCISSPELLGKKAYFYSKDQSNGMVIILDIGGTYEFYERVDGGGDK